MGLDERAIEEFAVTSRLEPIGRKGLKRRVMRSYSFPRRADYGVRLFASEPHEKRVSSASGPSLGRRARSSGSRIHCLIKIIVRCRGATVDISRQRALLASIGAAMSTRVQSRDAKRLSGVSARSYAVADDPGGLFTRVPELSRSTQCQIRREFNE